MEIIENFELKLHGKKNIKKKNVDVGVIKIFSNYDCVKKIKRARIGGFNPHDFNLGCAGRMMFHDSVSKINFEQVRIDLIMKIAREKKKKKSLPQHASINLIEFIFINSAHL